MTAHSRNTALCAACGCALAGLDQDSPAASADALRRAIMGRVSPMTRRIVLTVRDHPGIGALALVDILHPDLHPARRASRADSIHRTIRANRAALEACGYRLASRAGRGGGYTLLPIAPPPIAQPLDPRADPQAPP